ncbi:hypothetical protein COCNU_06G012170 [Cocos nucifera]|uniref:Uncharacterized protein n=1 Tax=Cocos nucifera TaxID=13894 RepID=A0A8K0IBR4_COCNU|nr:hypothetical protein COCNU_06G012170 [Cocos nucifera]
MPRRKVLVGESKLCQKIRDKFLASLRTRLPDSKMVSAVSFVREPKANVDELPLPSTIIRSPSSLNIAVAQTLGAEEAEFEGVVGRKKYPSIFDVIHDITHLGEGLVGFNLIKRKLEGDLRDAKA